LVLRAKVVSQSAFEGRLVYGVSSLRFIPVYSRLRVLAARRDFIPVAKQSDKARKSGAVAEPEGVGEFSSSGRTEQLLTDLNVLSHSSLSDMAPGDIVFLDDFACLRKAVAASFVAVLACPGCGALILITSAQFSGAATFICTSNACPGLFRIIDENQLVSLPPI
jgi:hypothetical protein